MNKWNFPNRKKARREGALERLEKALAEAMSKRDGKKCIQLETAITNTKKNLSMN